MEQVRRDDKPSMFAYLQTKNLLVSIEKAEICI